MKYSDENIGKNLKFYLKARNIKQSELAKEVYLSRQSFSYYISGRTIPRVDTLCVIAEKLGVTPNALLAERQDDYPSEVDKAERQDDDYPSYLDNFVVVDGQHSLSEALTIIKRKAKSKVKK